MTTPVDTRRAVSAGTPEDAHPTADITLADAVARMTDAETTLRAIAAGEVDAFVFSGEEAEIRTFSLSTADRPYRMFVENMQDGAATVSAAGTILFVNRRLAALLGRPRSTIVGSSLADHLAGESSSASRTLLGANGFGAAFEIDLLDVHGGPVPVLVGSSLLDVDGGQSTCLTFTDLSAQRAQDREIARLGQAQEERMAELQRAEAALRHSEAQLTVILDALPVGVIVAHRETGVTYINRHAAGLVGQRVDASSGVGGLAGSAFRDGTDEPYPPDRLPMVRALGGESGTVLDLEVERQGRRIPTRISFAPIATDDGRVDMGLVAFADMSDEVADKRLLAVQAKDLERSNGELEQFAYIASHDLSEPLRTVAGFVQLLGQRYQGQLDDDADEFIGYALEGVTRMQALIQDLLTYSRVSRAEASPEPVDTERLVLDLAEDLGASEALTVVTAMPTVLADEGQLRRVFQNLFANAVKFAAPERTVRIEVSAVAVAGFWRISVRDNGIGIAPAHRDGVFKMFQRLHSQDDYAGTGIGLSVCERIIERHGGRIWLDGVEGEGTTFHFTVPTSP